MWILRDAAFDPIIPAEWFTRAQEAIAARSQRMDDASMLLHSLYEQTGAL